MTMELISVCGALAMGTYDSARHMFRVHMFATPDKAQDIHESLVKREPCVVVRHDNLEWVCTVTQMDPTLVCVQGYYWKALELFMEPSDERLKVCPEVMVPEALKPFRLDWTSLWNGTAIVGTAAALTPTLVRAAGVGRGGAVVTSGLATWGGSMLGGLSLLGGGVALATLLVARHLSDTTSPPTVTPPSSPVSTPSSPPVSEHKQDTTKNKEVGPVVVDLTQKEDIQPPKRIKRECQNDLYEFESDCQKKQ